MTIFSLREPTEEDVPFLLQLRAASLEPLELKAGMPVSVERSTERVLAHFSLGRLIEISDCPVGVVKVVPEASQWKLLQLQLMPAFQGNGIGTEIVKEVLERAKEAGMPVVLTVLKINPAKHLYERLGFKVVGEREYAYEMRASA